MVRLIKCKYGVNKKTKKCLKVPRAKKKKKKEEPIRIEEQSPEENYYVISPKDSSKKFYTRYGTKKKYIVVRGFDIDGSLTEGLEPYEKCKRGTKNICGVISHRDLPWIFEFAHFNQINPDFVCSAGLSKKQCLLLMKKKFPRAKKYTYFGDSVTDMEASKEAKVKFYPIEPIEKGDYVKTNAGWEYKPEIDRMSTEEIRELVKSLQEKGQKNIEQNPEDYFNPDDESHFRKLTKLQQVKELNKRRGF